MTELKTIVKRVTSARRHEKSKTRAVIVSLEPPASIGVRLQGTRQTYRLPAEAIYELAVVAHRREIERRARGLVKERKVGLGVARRIARKECGELLKP